MNNQNEVENKVLARVKKMLALGNCLGTTEHERDTALKQAYKLLAKHNLSIEQVGGDDEPEIRDNYKVAGWSMIWAKTAFMHIADLFFCEYYYGSKINATKCQHHFVGKEGNAKTAMHIANHVVISILKEGRSRYGDNLCPETRAFALGCVSKLRERIKELKAEAAKESAAEYAGGTALALVDVYASEKAANQLMLPSTLKPSRGSSKAVDAEAYHGGREFGKSISLNVRVGASISPASKALK